MTMFDQRIEFGTYITDQAKLTATQSRKAVAHFGSARIVEERLHENPYCLLEVESFGFVRADKVASNLGGSSSAPERMAAACEFVFLALDQHGGHCWRTYNDTVLSLRKMRVSDRFAKITELQAIDAVYDALAAGTLVENGGQIWHKTFLAAERYIAGFVNTYHDSNNIGRLDEMWAINHTATQEQQNAVIMVFNSPLSIIVGAAGTGKTKGILGLVQGTKKVNIVSFMAVAARRASNATGHTASTLHSFLYGERRLSNSLMDSWGDSERAQEIYADLSDQEDQLQDSLIVVDEASMLPVDLLAWLLKVAKKYSARVVLVGDDHQLPSLGPGQILYDLVASGKVPVTRLTKNLRTGQDGLITGADDVLHGNIPVSGEGLSIQYRSTSDQVTEDLIDLLASPDLPMGWEAAPVICWTNASRYDFNTAIQEIRNPFTPGRPEFHDSVFVDDRQVPRVLRVGDPIMHLKNDKDRGLVNGDVGVITKISGDQITAEYDPETNILTGIETPRFTTYDGSNGHWETPEFTLAYSFTCHKSQGNEYDYVIVAIPFGGDHLERSWLYTAMTRGSQKVLIVTTRTAMTRTVYNDKRGTRQTMLAARIRGEVS